MRVLVISGSRNPEGQTARAANALCQGVERAGGEVTGLVFLPEQKLERCRQCENNGWGTCRSEGRCIINDDLPVLLDKIRQADAVAFATPVYFGDLSESMRGFLERVRRVAFNETGKMCLAGKPVVGLCVAGGRGLGAPGAAKSLERMLLTCGFDVLDVVPARKQNLEMKLAVLETTGRWLAEQPIPA